jgi:hypothetical protein
MIPTTSTLDLAAAREPTKSQHILNDWAASARIEAAGVADFLRQQAREPQAAQFTLLLATVRLAVFGEGYLNRPERMPSEAPQPKDLIEPSWKLADQISRELARDHAFDTFQDSIAYLAKRAEQAQSAAASGDYSVLSADAYYDRWCQGFCLEMLAGHQPLPELLNEHLQDPEARARFIGVLERFTSGEAVLPAGWDKDLPDYTPENKATFDSQVASVPDNYARICALAVLENIKKHSDLGNELKPIWKLTWSNSSQELLAAYERFLPSMAPLTSLAQKFCEDHC